MSKSIFESKAFKKVMAMSYGLGAAIVILGALFKILHWKGADVMLTVGMITEAIIFLVSAFEPLHQDVDWTLVYPELAGMDGDGDKRKGSGGKQDSVSQELDKMLEDAKIGPELIEGLGTGLRSLTENVGQMANLSGATVATKEYAENVQKANEALVGMNDSYARTIEALSSLAETSENVRQTGSQIASINENLAAFDGNIKNLNSIYGGMLNAMRVSS
jgi:gliding motility-associated protein GldL